MTFKQALLLDFQMYFSGHLRIFAFCFFRTFDNIYILFFQDILTEGDYFDKDRYRLGAKLSIQKDDVQAVLPITKVRKKNI
jgi:hypothetical protein